MAVTAGVLVQHEDVLSPEAAVLPARQVIVLGRRCWRLLPAVAKRGFFKA